VKLTVRGLVRILADTLSISDNTTRLKSIIHKITETENLIDNSLKHAMAGRVTSGRRRIGKILSKEKVARAFGRSKVTRIFKRNRRLRGAGY
jgi:hypothetical protein